MTTISSNPYSSIATLLNPVSPTATGGSTDTTAELDSLIGGSSASGSGSANPILSLLGSSSSNQSALSTSVLSALQSYQETNSTAVASLFGNNTNSLTGGLEDVNSVYDQALQTAYQIAGVSSSGSGTAGTSSGSGSAASTTTPDPIQSLLNSYNSAINAYNTTLLNQAQTVLEDNSSLTA